MRWLRRTVVRIAGLFTKSRRDRELAEELASHVAMQVADHVRAGLSPTEARRRALVTLGGIDSIREQYDVTRGIRWLEDAARDLRYGWRALRRTPGFTLTAVVTLAFTIGAVSTVLTIADTLFFRYLPVPDADALVEVAVTRNAQPALASYPDYAHLRDTTRTLEGLAAHYSSAPLQVETGAAAGGGAPGGQLNGAVVSANFFPVLGLQPALGRFFGPEEDRVPDRDRVAVISHDLWTRWYFQSPEVLGAELTVNDVTFTIVGVAPETFRGLSIAPSDVYLPTMMLSTGYRWCDDSLAADCTILRMIGRLPDRARLGEARAELATTRPPWWSQARDADSLGVSVVPQRGAAPTGGEGQVMQLLALVAAALLLVCCANLAGLLIARGVARARELAIRASLGASRLRLVRQLLTESVLLAVIGGVLGVGLSTWMTALLGSQFYSADYAGRALFYDFSLRPAIVGAVLGLSLLTGIAFGVLPALRSIRRDTAERMKHQSAGAGARTAIGQWLIGGQAAAAVALVALAALLASSAGTLVSGTNFDPAPVAVLRVRPNLLGYTPGRAQRFMRAAIDGLRAVPGVTAARPAGTAGVLAGFEADVSRPEAERAVAPLRAGYVEIGRDYFDALGIRLVGGRDFEERDRAGAPPVAIVSAGLAGRLWPDRNAIGRTIGVGAAEDRGADRTAHRRHEVVGVVPDIVLQSRAEPLKPYVYLPYWQNPTLVDARVVVRVTGDPAGTLPTLVAAVHAVDAEVPVTETVPLAGQIAGSFRTLRMSAAFVGYAGALTVLLSAVGLYGAMAFAVSRRTREIGVRLAIGAAPMSILGMIAREGMSVVAVGAALGVGLALGGRRLLLHLLYGPASGDPIVLASALGIVLAVGLLACWLPARRAAAIEPTQALRHD